MTLSLLQAQAPRVILSGFSPSNCIKDNVALYPKFQEYLRVKQPSLLAVWGKNDPFFLPAGAEAFKRDNPNAEVHFYDTGHFALETHLQEIAGAIRDFLGRKLASKATTA